jgi:hypothetical protein
MIPADFVNVLSALLATYGQQFVALAGTAALIAALVNAAKATGKVPDGSAGNLSLVLNAVAFVVLLIVRLVRPDFNVAQLDGVADELAVLLNGVIAIVLQTGGTKLFHLLFKNLGLPLIGKSLSREA